jgi:hypothetical protein
MDKVIEELLSLAQQTQKSRKHSVKLCPDQLIGKIEYNPRSHKVTMVGKVTTKFFDGCKRKNVAQVISHHSSAAMVLILESPHIDEYDDKKLPIGPAYGKTGENINLWFDHILDEAISQKGVGSFINSNSV